MLTHSPRYATRVVGKLLRDIPRDSTVIRRVEEGPLQHARHAGRTAPTLSNQRSDIDHRRPQRGDPDRHRQRHDAVDPTHRTLLRGLAVAGVIQHDHGVVRAHVEDG